MISENYHGKDHTKCYASVAVLLTLARAGVINADLNKIKKSGCLGPASKEEVKKQKKQNKAPAAKGGKTGKKKGGKLAASES